MTAKQLYSIVLFHFGIVSFCISQKSGYVGGSLGPAFGQVLNLSRKPDYNANSTIKSGVMLSSYYESETDSITHFRVGLQYQFQQADLEVNYNSKGASFYNNVNYTFHQAKLNWDYTFLLVDKQRMKLEFLFGIGVGYNFNTYSKGNGWEDLLQYQTDTSGNSVGIVKRQDWTKNEHHSNDIAHFFFGANWGLQVSFPISDQMSIVLQNGYFLSVPNWVTQQNKYRSTLFISGNLGAGLCYQLKRK